MTEEQLPTRRSLRLARQAAEREAKLRQVTDAGAEAGTEAENTADDGPAPAVTDSFRPTLPSDDAAESGSPSLPVRRSSVFGARTDAPYATGPVGAFGQTSVDEAPSDASADVAAPGVPVRTPIAGTPFAAQSAFEPDATGPAAFEAAAAGPDATEPAPAGPDALGPSTTESDAPGSDEALFGDAAFHPASFTPASAGRNLAADIHADEDDEDRVIDIAHARERKSHRIIKAVALSLVALLAFSTAGAAAIYNRMSSNMDIAKVGDLVQNTDPDSTFEPPSDPGEGKALNYLVIGVDDRTGENAELSDKATQGSRSDTTMLMHISEDRKRVDVVSIPRDTMLNVPSCVLSDKRETSAYFGMFNTAYATGFDQGGDVESAIACVWRTVQEASGVKIDGAVMVDFAGFASVIEAIGGVYMCIPEETISRPARLHLQPGWQTLNSREALGYARARKGQGQNFDGSDLTRAGRQQQLVAAIFNQVSDDGLLSNPAKLFTFADAVTKTLTVTDTLSSTADIAGLAYSLRNIRSKNMTLMTIPIEGYPPDRNRVQLSAAATDIWDRLREDLPLLDTEDADEVTGDETADSDDTTDPTGTGDSTVAGGGNANTSDAATETAQDEPKPTKTAGREAFTAEDNTAVCSAPATKKKG